jgi:hypothetical protein
MLTGASKKSRQFGLIALMVLGALMLWLGNPVIWLWIGSQMTTSQQGSFGPYAVVAIGILGSTIAVAVAIARLNRLYERVCGEPRTVRVRLRWLRSLRDQRASDPHVTVLDFILLSTALAGIAAFVVWFAFFAGSSLPGS